MSGTTNTDGYLGPMQPNTASDPLNTQAFLIQQLLGRIGTTMLVQVVAVSNAGGIEPVGIVDVHPLVNQIDGQGKGTPHGIIFSLPYFRLQGGADAIIIDPKVGDIGFAVVCNRDISSVKATKAEANPSSFRQFDSADGLYVGGVLNGVPTQYLAMTGDGISIVARQTVTITAPTKVTIESPIVEITGEVQAVGEVTAKYGTGAFNRITTHTHGGGVPPTPGT